MAEENSAEVEKSIADFVEVKGKNLDVTDTLHDYVCTRLSKIEKIAPHGISAVVYLETRRGSVNVVEILYHFSHFHVMVSGRADDMYEAIDVSVAKLQHKLRKWKSRIQDHHKKVPVAEEKELSILDRKKEDLDEINDMIDEENLRKIDEEMRPPQVVKREKQKIPTLTMDEACMKVELEGRSFLIYRSEEDQKIKVLYPQGDRTLGIIEVE